MATECITGCGIVLAGLSFLAYLIVAVFVVPINGQCDFNSVIPQNAAINLSMEDWIYGAMGGGVSVFWLIGSFSKNSSNSDCLAGFIAGYLILYVFFTFSWSIIGLVIYSSSNYYPQACQSVQSYEIIINLGMYFGLVFSSLLILALLIAIISVCAQSCCPRRESVSLLQQHPQNFAPAPRIDRYVAPRIDGDVIAANQLDDIEYAKAIPKQEQVVISDAQFQQNRNIYEYMFNRLSRNSRRSSR